MSFQTPATNVTPAPLGRPVLPLALGLLLLAACALAADDGPRVVAAERGLLQQVASAAAGADKTTVTLFSDGFEDGFPGTAWQVTGLPGGPTWGRWTCWSSSGSYSVGCAAAGTPGIACGENYPSNMNVWMVHGPFSLADASFLSATFEATVDLNTVPDQDSFYVGASTDGEQYVGTYYEGTTSGVASLDLTDYLGEAQVWVAFYFESDESSGLPNGAQVDDVALLVESSAVPTSTLALAHEAGQGGATASVPLSLDNEVAVKAWQLDVIFDPEVAEFTGIQASGRGAAMTTDSTEIGPGQVRVLAYLDGAAQLEPGTGEVASLSFDLVGASGTSTPLTPTEAVLSGVDAESLPVEVVAGSLTVETGNGVPLVHLAALPNPGRPRHVQVLVTVVNGSGSAPSVTANGSAVNLQAVTGDVYRGDLHLADTTASVTIQASDTNANGTGDNQVTLTFD